ncbi:anthranilate synthase component II [Clostridium akagii]|uniref:anthranilate synthase component II n=1 Tax=Clostridium akagii TaxID=91623 RepID=UPI00047E714D|nr:aminodeoxychorismate/anthranilate synthase component II [Clostridium akagii]
MFLIIDNYDSFVYNLARYFEEINEKVLIYRNDKISVEKIKDINPEGIIISPGPKSPKEAGSCLEIIEQFKEKIPILGICLGHQAIAQCFGCEIIKGIKPAHGKISEVFHNGQGVFKGIKNPFKATRYHSLIVKTCTLPSTLYVTAETKDGVIMGIKHNKYCLEGVQFHPEAELTEFGHEILENFVNEARIYNNVLEQNKLVYND